MRTLPASSRPVKSKTFSPRVLSALPAGAPGRGLLPASAAGAASGAVAASSGAAGWAWAGAADRDFFERRPRFASAGDVHARTSANPMTDAMIDWGRMTARSLLVWGFTAPTPSYAPRLLCASDGSPEILAESGPARQRNSSRP